MISDRIKNFINGTQIIGIGKISLILFGLIDNYLSSSEFNKIINLIIGFLTCVPIGFIGILCLIFGLLMILESFFGEYNGRKSIQTKF